MFSRLSRAFICFSGFKVAFRLCFDLRAPCVIGIPLFLLAVSFFGASHINMPLQEAKLSTNVRLKFRSRQSNALIFLTSGRTDHCLLTLNEGRIKFQLKINEYETEASTMRAPRTASINQFHLQLFYSSGHRNSSHSTISCGTRW
jgi:hypothetical protein